MMGQTTEINQSIARLDQLNYATAVFIPKKNIAECVTEYRPIFL